ncbi:hypothetical protein MMC14_008590 [Varicellaria rhodocarpa]|nr:hypothetical protein [Varicellaria rhodocarpa]
MGKKVVMTEDLDAVRRYQDDVQAFRARVDVADRIPKEVYRDWLNADTHAISQTVAPGPPPIRWSKKPVSLQKYDQEKGLFRRTPTEKDPWKEADVSSVKSPGKARSNRHDYCHDGAPIKPLPRVSTEPAESSLRRRDSRREWSPGITGNLIRERLPRNTAGGLPIQTVPRYTAKLCHPPFIRQRSMRAIFETTDPLTPPELDVDSNASETSSTIATVGKVVSGFNKSDTSTEYFSPSLDVTSTINPSHSRKLVIWPTESLLHVDSDPESEDACHADFPVRSAIRPFPYIPVAIKERIIRYPSPITPSTVHPALRKDSCSSITNAVRSSAPDERATQKHAGRDLILEARKNKMKAENKYQGAAESKAPTTQRSQQANIGLKGAPPAALGTIRERRLRMRKFEKLELKQEKREK